MVPSRYRPSMTQYATFAVALLTITNPIGAMAIFAGIVGDRPPRERTSIARTAAVAVAVILVVVVWAGSAAMSMFGITPQGLQAAGGVILVLMGLSMLNSQTPRQKSTKKETEEAQVRDSVSVVPLALPIIAGPGAITTVILATQELPRALDRVALSLICVGIAFLVWICLTFAAPISRMIGITGIRIVSRIMGLILTAIAFEMLAAGLTALMPGLAG